MYSFEIGILYGITALLWGFYAGVVQKSNYPGKTKAGRIIFAILLNWFFCPIALAIAIFKKLRADFRSYS